MLDVYDRLIRIVNRLVLAVIMVLGTAMLVICLAHIFWRYALNNSLTWSEEIMKIMVVWFCLLSATFISSRREHVSIVVFKQMLPKWIERRLDVMVACIMFLCALAMCWIGWRLTRWAGNRRTAATGFPVAYQYFSIFCAFGIMAFYELRNFLSELLQPGRGPAVKESLPPIAIAPVDDDPVAEDAAGAS
ncbi:MAG: TRAP transporter small permease [Planctomycetota bacterium]|jgi:TRAP-type C4-dicarboxylate transport system permease small subunit|nr:TRAP transporter small permease [Planctomycetota bacterium]